MYNLDIYNTKVENNNMIYSVDKIRLKTYINYQQFKDLESYIRTYFNDNIKKFWLSDKKNSFHYNYNIEVGENKSFIFQFMHNMETINYDYIRKEYNFTIEFNPNKLKDNFLIIHILTSFSNWLLRSFDLAIDVPINILDIIIDKKTKRSFKMFSSGGDNVTYYVGSKEKDGSIKIYNKKIESNLNIVGYLTRFEITRKYEDLPLLTMSSYDFGNHFFPQVYLNQYVFSFSDITTKDKTLMALLYAVQSGYPLNNLSRRYKEKIEELLEGGSAITFDKDSANKALLQCIFYYFVRKDSKQIFM